MRDCSYALDATWRPLLKDLNLSPANVLRRAGLREDLLTQPDVRLEAEDFYRFWNAIEAELNDPLFPLRVCQTIKSEAFSPSIFAALCSPNFFIASQRIARYKKLIAPMQLNVSKQDGQMSLTLAWLDSAVPPASLVATELLFFVSLARIGTREPIAPLKVETSAPPTALRAYEDYLCARIYRGPAHRLVFAQNDAERPFLTCNDGMWGAFEPELRTRLAHLDARALLAQRVRSILLEALPSGMVAMEAVSRKLAMSKRTLQRQLEAEGVTYKKLLQETRVALARHYLHKTKLPTSQISFLLGFEEPNSFYRAFREWTGQTPEGARQHGPGTH